MTGISTSEEEVAFAQAISEIEDAPQSWASSGNIGGGHAPSPLEEAVSKPDANTPPPPQYFLGELTEEQVLEKLSTLDKVEERLVNKLMGHLGPLGREIKSLKEALGSAKEVQFDAEALAPLKALDEGIYDVLVSGLTKGLKVQNVSDQLRPFVEEQVQSAQGAFALTMKDAVEQRLLETLLPNYLTISETPGFTDWILKNQPAEIVQAFRDWDDETGAGKKNAPALLSGYKAFLDAKQKSESIKNTREDVLKRSAVPVKSSGADARQGVSKGMTEEEAFSARMREIEEKGLRL